MSAQISWWNWLRRWKQRRAWEQKRREFVYLDEVSVTSLVAAREGSVAESFKHSLSATTSSEAGSSFGVSSTQGSPSVGLSSKFFSAETRGQEVVRRAVVQGTFRGLRIGDANLKLSVEDQRPRMRPRAATTGPELATRIGMLEKQRRAVPVSKLDRGDVVEVRFELNAERTYQMTAAVTSMLDLVKGSTGTFGIAGSQVAEVEMLAELLRRLLVDLVPVTARLTSHRHVVLNGQAWLVDATMIAAGSPLQSETEDATVVGVTELPLYWKDVRRVLFDGSSYTGYVRLAKPGLQSSWSPVKLADLFDQIVPDLGYQMRQLPLLFSAANDVRDCRNAVSVPDILREHALIPFGKQLALLANRSVDEDALSSVASSAAQRVDSVENLGDVGIVRAVFAEVVDLVEGSEPVDRELVRILRESHQSIARLQVALSIASQVEAEPQEEQQPDHLLEAEFVAIYW